MKPKTLAMYLPQFHRVAENDEWWGEGFTEWTAVKGAQKLYKEHNQPRMPLNLHYYNLLEHDTMAWQAELMQKYQVDGMCIYHYWFEKGRRILEKPAENLLKWTDIHMPFCFCWANETWSRTWKKLAGANVWSRTYEPKRASEENGILLKQNYGRETDWEEHFQYLLPFFKDDRYMKLNGMPVFVILKPSDVFSLWNMTYYFEMKAKENGFPGIYIIGMEESRLAGVDAVCIPQPRYAISEYFKEHTDMSQQECRVYPYDDIWELILRQRRRKGKTYLCGAVDYDDTPRMGKSGNLIEGAEPDKFYQYFKRLYQKSMSLKNEFIFLNAWNEWGECMYLEPDEQNGYGYLEALSRAVEECREEQLPQDRGIAEDFDEPDEEEKVCMKVKSLQVLCKQNAVLDKWLHLKDHNIFFAEYFKKYGYQNIAIYGMGKLGIHLLHELKAGDLKVSFGIDRNSEAGGYPIKVYNPDGKMPEVDAVVITAIGEYGEISEKLSRNMNASMIALEEIIQELMP